MLWSLERSPGRLGERILPSLDLCGRKEQFFRMSAERREREGEEQVRRAEILAIGVDEWKKKKENGRITLRELQKKGGRGSDSLSPSPSYTAESR